MKKIILILLLVVSLFNCTKLKVGQIWYKTMDKNNPFKKEWYIYNEILNISNDHILYELSYSDVYYVRTNSKNKMFFKTYMKLKKQ